MIGLLFGRFVIVVLSFYFRRFALETVAVSPALLGIRKLGHDMDDALAGGLADVFQDATHFYCTQHIQQADIRQLRKMEANESSTKRIIADIYGCQTGISFEIFL